MECLMENYCRNYPKECQKCNALSNIYNTIPMYKDKGKMIKFVLDGCDISFVAEAPEDITLKQLIEQCDKIVPNYCACGISSLEKKEYDESVQTEIEISYNSVRKTHEDVSCWIEGEEL